MTLLRRSLAARMVTFLLVISAMAIASMSLTVVIAKSSQGDAAAINIAGSLRLNSAQLIEALQRAPRSEQRNQEVAQLVERLSSRLDSSELIAGPNFMRDEESRQGLNALRQQWHQTLVPLIEQMTNNNTADSGEAKTALNYFIGDIDRFVSQLEASAESRVQLLSAMQALFLVLIVPLIVIALYDIRQHVVIPLRQLMVLSREAGRRNFDYRSNFQSLDELGRLGRTFDQMSAELNTSYRELEARVSHKQAELERHNRALQIIHNGIRMLYGGGNDLCASAAPMLRELEKLLELGPIVLSLHSEHDDSDTEILATHSAERPLFCRDLACFACLEDSPHGSNKVGHDNEALIQPVAIGQQTLGYLTVGYATPPSASTRQLLNTLTDHLATAIYLQQRIEEQQQLSLIKERTIIARELHDSLAQSLSYLKMQVTRLERMQAKQFPVEQQNSVMGDLREGLNSAYRQLRELLGTFRLSLDKPGLHPALQQTVDEFSARLGFSVDLIYQVPPHLLSANEEVHLLQVTREALANTFKHAHAHWAQVSLTFHQAALTLAIEDDGIGLEDDRSPPMHYGLIIMRDRANNIDADLSVTNRPEGGTGIYLTFTPQTERLIEEGST
ncbi:type IV pili methyl-accepting chemotaxis transducer N-terminal domain-containing protein [Halomonas sp. SH5A2]|uniref:histidine kinase n=1 Tax=Halomonas sp. SH5A2 TaxID=2749040 RepID=UPI001640AFAE|nr:histidine kinase [Halomonas sp. SH5A2]QNI02934.1 type IV pili methyl-accepting chemotaxis transducer N-terminal domain-containing protein [Halomonas sp. SH5A2]